MRYLNSKPLIHGHGEEVSFEVPASLADGLHEGRLDVALSPIFELMAHPGYLVVDDVAIASRGPVFSVFIAYQGDHGQIAHAVSRHRLAHLGQPPARIARGSSTIVHPTRSAAPGGSAPGRNCERARARCSSATRPSTSASRGGSVANILTLGTEWQRAMGLPFVFAAWLVQPDTPEPEALADRLRAWREDGQRHIDQVVADETRYPLGLTRFYLTERIRFRLGEPERQAIREFARLLHKHGLADATALAEPRWI